MNTRNLTALVSAMALLFMATTAQAQATYTRQNNATTLNLAGAWSAGGPPIGVDTAKWDSTIPASGGNPATALGASVTWGQILITNPGQAITIGNTAAAVLTLNGVGGVGIDMSAATQNLTINNLVTLGGAQTWTVGTGRTLSVGVYAFNLQTNTLTVEGAGITSITGSIGGSGGIIKNGSGRMTFHTGNANTYTGPTTINGGHIMIANNINSLGAGNLTLNGGILEAYWGLTISRILGAGYGEMQLTGGASGFSQNGAGQTFTVTVNNDAAYELVWDSTYFSPSVLALQTAYSQNGANVTLSNKINLNGSNRTIEVNAGNAGTAKATLSGVIRNSTGTAGVIKTGAGELILSAANTFNGQLTVENGKLSIASINNVSANGVLGNSALAVILGASGQTGTLSYTGGTASSTKPFTMATGGTGAFEVSTAATILTLSGQIDGSGALTKIGAGTLLLTGTGTYTGTTTVSAGTLTINSPVSITASSAVNLNAGGALIGTGTIAVPLNVGIGATLSTTTLTYNGLVSGVAGAANISPAGFGTLGTLTLGAGLTLNAGNAFECDLGTTSGSSDGIAITGDLVLNGTSYVAYNVPTGSAAANATYTIMTWTGSRTGDALVFPNGTTTMNGATLNIGANSVTITTGPSGITTGTRNVTWSGASSYVWNSSTVNWLDSSTPTAYAYGDNVTFNDSGLAVSPITGTPATPASVTVNTSSKTYTIAASIGGSGSLTKSGTSLLKLSGANTFTGGLVLNAGTVGDNSGAVSTAALNNNTVTVNGNASLGLAGGATTSGGIALNNGSVLSIGNNNSSITVSGAVTGNGGLSIIRLGDGANTLNLNSTANTFTGGIDYNSLRNITVTVNSFADSASYGAGKIRFAVGNPGVQDHIFALGTGYSASLTLNNRQFELTSTSTSYKAFIRNNSAQAFTINSDLLVSGTGAKSLTLGGTGAGLCTFAGKIIDGTGAMVSLTKADVGRWILSGANTFSGTTTVSGGTLELAAGTCLSDTNRLTIAGTGLNKVHLNEGVREKVGFLTLNATPSVPVAGTWGSTTSDADNKNDTYFSGTGVLYVGVDLPPMGTMIIIR